MTKAIRVMPCLLALAAGGVRAEQPPGTPPPRTLTIEAGKGTSALVMEAELQTRFGLVMGGGAGRGGIGPAVEAHIGYQLPFGTNWTLRPGVRASRLWGKADGCAPRCEFDFVTVEMAVHYRGPSGFVFEYGLPLVAWIPVGPEGAETAPHLQFYAFSGEVMGFFSSILFGYAFEL